MKDKPLQPGPAAEPARGTPGVAYGCVMDRKSADALLALGIRLVHCRIIDEDELQ